MDVLAEVQVFLSIAMMDCYGTLLPIATVNFLRGILHPLQINISVFPPLIFRCPTP
jgi:hypothetical protein